MKAKPSGGSTSPLEEYAEFLLGPTVERPDMTLDEIVAAMSKAGEKGADRPGRAFKRAGTNLRSAVEDTDWHDLKEHRFLHPAAGAMERLIRERETKALVVVAPPRALADQRSTFHTEVKSCIIAEIDKDLTHQRFTPAA